MTSIEAVESTASEYDREMADKLEKIKRDPEGYYARARKAAYRDELRRALVPWAKPRTRTT